MDFSKLVRDQDKIHACLKELPDERLVAVKALKIYIPVRFAERGLAQIGIETHVTGIVMYVTEDKYYAISLFNAMFRTEPTSTMKVKVGEDEYYEFSYEPGSTVMSSLQLVKTDTLVYKIYKELFDSGHVPQYVGYDDLGKVFDTAKKHAGANIGQQHEVTELLVAMVARNPDNRREYWRQVLKNYTTAKSAKSPAFISLRNVNYAATNTTNKLAGSYFHDGVVSALNNPSTRVERIESLLRK